MHTLALKILYILESETKKNDVTNVSLLHGDPYDWKDGKWIHSSIPMTVSGTDALYEYWFVSIKPEFRRLRYGFKLEDEDETIYLGDKGFGAAPWDDVAYYFCFPFLHPNDVFDAPNWVKDTVWYQIFPERFANGDQSNDPEGTLPWGGAAPTPENFFGGDLKGVIEKIPYLKRLGISGIYFTPIFKAYSNHKYDTIDYMEIDPQFGTKEDLVELVNTCHEQGIKVMLDAVFNHSGFYFPQFQDVLENGENSKYKNWFHTHEFPLKTDDIPNYDTFGFVPQMPKLNTQNHEVREYLLEVGRYWVREFNIDGWRLDVANEVDHQFWRDFRTEVRSIKPELYILGEIWHDSMPWLHGDQFDAVMNYPFTTNLLNLFAKQSITAKEFVWNMTTVNHMYPSTVNAVQFNLIGSHDTPRVLTEAGEDKNRLKQIFNFLLTFIGTPCIYYGDEIGLTGEQDPGCRKCMPWDESEQDLDLFTHVQTLLRLRKEVPLLGNEGTFTFLNPDQHEHVIGYTKTDGRTTILMLMNTSSLDQEYKIPFNLKGKLIKNLWTEKEYAAEASSLIEQLPPYGFTILAFEE